MLNDACLDCHSNQTNYLWYHSVSQSSWMVAGQIKRGIHDLNFSLWGKMDIYNKIVILEEMYQEAERKKMPLKPHIQMHRRAKFSEEQIVTLRDRATTLSEKLLNSIEN
ncbi:MAG: heme-binding domain-containing protein [Prolixibacteraceae bacterium]|nr:heme-binding domain-containing protein [Prolixibacteraceae bacterium]